MYTLPSLSRALFIAASAACLFAVGVHLQQAQPAIVIHHPLTTSAPDPNAKWILFIEKGMPYSGIRVVNTTTHFPDGQVKNTVSFTKEWRDYDGRTRHETTWTNYMGEQITATVIKDPIQHIQYIWRVGPQIKTVVTISQETNYQENVVWGPPTSQRAPESYSNARIVILSPYKRNPTEKDEKLEPRYIDGVYVEGSRSTEILPVPQGTTQPSPPRRRIDEMWTAPDLNGMPIKMFLDDGWGTTQTDELKDIKRDDPDPALFTPPPGLPTRTAPMDDPAWKEPIG